MSDIDDSDDFFTSSSSSDDGLELINNHKVKNERFIGKKMLTGFCFIND